jgi:hypothetical protein
MDSANSQYYVLIAGRWFTSTTLQNRSWSFVSGTELPVGFPQFPSYSPKASVLVSIPGTPQAKEALVANSIPQTAAIKINAVSLTLSMTARPIFSRLGLRAL